MRNLVLAGILLSPTLATAAGPQHFVLEASFVAAPKPGANAAIAVSFRALSPDVQVDESPPPRLKLSLEQKILVDKQPPPPTHIKPFDPETAKFLDLAVPVTFAVAVAPGAPKGAQTVKAAVTYFYCSKTEAWCRRGSTDVDVSVLVR
jgi:hypothetical protein